MRKKILIIEDEIDLIKVLKDTFEKGKFSSILCRRWRRWDRKIL